MRFNYIDNGKQCHNTVSHIIGGRNSVTRDTARIICNMLELYNAKSQGVQTISFIAEGCFQDPTPILLFHSDAEYSRWPWFIYSHHDAKDHSYTLTPNPCLRGFYRALKKYGEIYDLEDMLCFSRRDSVLLFEFIQAAYNTSNSGIITMSIDQIRDICEIDDDKYKLTANLKSQMIDVAIQEINTKTHLHIDVFAGYSGKKYRIEDFSFILRPLDVHID